MRSPSSRWKEDRDFAEGVVAIAMTPMPLWIWFAAKCIYDLTSGMSGPEACATTLDVGYPLMVWIFGSACAGVVLERLRERAPSGDAGPK